MEPATGQAPEENCLRQKCSPPHMSTKDSKCLKTWTRTVLSSRHTGRPAHVENNVYLQLISRSMVRLSPIIAAAWHVSCGMRLDVLVIVLRLNAMTIMSAFLSRRDWRTCQGSTSQSCSAGDGDGGHSCAVRRMRLGRLIGWFVRWII